MAVKSEVIASRLTDGDAYRVRRAAEARGLTVSAFVSRAAVREADRVLEGEDSADAASEETGGTARRVGRAGGGQHLGTRADQRDREDASDGGSLVDTGTHGVGGPGPLRPRDPRSEDVRVREAWADFLKSLSFDHKVDLTFKWELSMDAAARRLEKWSNGLGRITQGPVAWVAFPETGAEGRLHLHALLVGTEGVPSHQLERSWGYRNGRAEIMEFEAERGGEEYVTKEITVDRSEARFSSNFDRVVRRRGEDLRCQEG